MTATSLDQVTMLKRGPERIGGVASVGDPPAGHDVPLRFARPTAAERPARRHVTPSYLASLVDIMPILPTVGTTTTVFAYIGGIPFIAAQSPRGALLFGAVVALLLAIVTACLHRALFTSAEHAHPRSYAEIRQRLDTLTSQLRTLEADTTDASRPDALEEAATHIWALERELTRGGPQWIIGTGYVDAMERLHRAEEALIMVQSASNLLAGALFDELRVAGSTMSGRERLAGQLRDAIQSLRPAVDATEEAAPTPISDAARVSEDAETRISLRDVRHALNDFRDERRAQLVRVRSRLLGTMTLTGVITYVLLAFAISLDGNNAATLNNPIISASAIYLVGAVVGLFNRLYVESADDSAGEDYGLSKARLLLTPMLSGLAAVGGVLVTGMLTGVVDVNVLSPAVNVGTQSNVPDGGPVLFSLRQVFSLGEYPFSLILAAMFGLAPKTFLKRLHQASEQSKLDLQSTAAR